MKIHPSKLEALTAALLDGLASVRVFGKRLVLEHTLADMAAAEAVMAGHGDNQRVLADAVDADTPVRDITRGFLSIMLATNDWDNELLNESLFEVPGIPPLPKTARLLAEFIASMPLSYRLLFPLPSAFADHMPDVPVVQLSGEMRLRRAGADGFEEYSPTTGNKFLDQYVFHSLADKSSLPTLSGAYLEVDEAGFIARDSSTLPRVRAVERLHSVLGLAMAFGVLGKSRMPHIGRGKDYYVYRESDDGEVNFNLVDYAALSPAASALVTELTTPINYFRALDGSTERKAMWIFLDHLSAVVSHNADSRRIENAGKWYFDSHASNDPLLSFVQMMVVLEILYGDKELSDKIGLGELLRNRCAYAIGKGAADREEIVREFKSIYDVRSQIVHRGKNRLSAKERELFNKLSGFCQRAIYHEANLLRQDVGKLERPLDADFRQGLLF